jgi:hypothetical protein
MSDFYIEYSDKPRYIDGINIDADVAASHPKVATSLARRTLTERSYEGLL